jgi:AraC-like DNA-binding protein
VLTAETVLSLEGLEIADICCRHGPGRGAPEESQRHAISFVRRGCFVRAGDSGEALLDPSAAFFVNPGCEQRYDHPHEGGDDCTAFMLEPELLASLWGGEPHLPQGPLHVPTRLDAAHRLLLTRARRGADPAETLELAIGLLAAVLAVGDQERVDAGKPARGSERQAIVDRARESLAADAGQTLTGLARLLAVSPHHLSRIFRRSTGHTVSRYRLRLRARAALERLAEGEENLARLAADLGFADQSHLCRVIRSETGETPSALRAALAEGAPVR